MNAVVSTTGSDAGMLAILTANPSVAPPPPTQEPAAFFNIVNLLLTPDAGGLTEIDSDAGAQSAGDAGLPLFQAAETAISSSGGSSPLQLADALIRGMLKSAPRSPAKVFSSTTPVSIMNPAEPVAAEDAPTVETVAAQSPNDPFPVGTEVSLSPEALLRDTSGDEPLPSGASPRKKKMQDPILPDAVPNKLALSTIPPSGPIAIPTEARIMPDSSSGAAANPSTLPSTKLDQGNTVTVSNLTTAPQLAKPASTTAGSPVTGVAFHARLVEKSDGAAFPVCAAGSLHSNGEVLPATMLVRADEAGGDGSADEQSESPKNSPRGAREVAEPVASGESSQSAMPTAFLPIHAPEVSAASPRMQSPSEAPVAHPRNAVESVVASPPSAPQTGSREIAVRVIRSDSQPVDLQVRQRAGQIQVAVRTSDAALRNSLRAELPTLVESLDRTGFRTESLTDGSGQVPTLGSPAPFEGATASTAAQGAFQDDSGLTSGGRSFESPTQSAGQSPGSDDGNARERFNQNWREQMEEQ